MAATQEIDRSGAKTARRRDTVALGIAVGAIVMFIGTGSAVLPAIMRQSMGVGAGPDQILTTALLLQAAIRAAVSMSRRPPPL